MTDITLDTNVLLRYFLGDIEEQFIKAREVIEAIEEKKSIGKISILVINELVWIFEKYYRLERKVYVPKIQKLLLLENIKIIEIKKGDLKNILEIFQKKKFDFTDIYLNFITTSGSIFSFDKDFQKMQ